MDTIWLFHFLFVLLLFLSLTLFLWCCIKQSSESWSPVPFRDKVSVYDTQYTVKLSGGVQSWFWKQSLLSPSYFRPKHAYFKCPPNPREAIPLALWQEWKRKGGQQKKKNSPRTKTQSPWKQPKGKPFSKIVTIFSPWCKNACSGNQMPEVHPHRENSRLGISANCLLSFSLVSFICSLNAAMPVISARCCTSFDALLSICYSLLHD